MKMKKKKDDVDVDVDDVGVVDFVDGKREKK